MSTFCLSSELAFASVSELSQRKPIKILVDLDIRMSRGKSFSNLCSWKPIIKALGYKGSYSCSVHFPQGLNNVLIKHLGIKQVQHPFDIELWDFKHQEAWVCYGEERRKALGRSPGLNGRSTRCERKQIKILVRLCELWAV